MNVEIKAVRVVGCLLGLAATLMPPRVGARPHIDQPTSHYVRPSNDTGPFKDRAIVFVHGIFGDSISSWTASNGAYWPELLLKDTAFDKYDIYVANYDSPAFGNTFTVDEVVASLQSRLVANKVFEQHHEVVFVCHSLGGIIVQQLLLTYRAQASRVPFVYFFSVPAEGSQIANIGRYFNSDPLLNALFHGDENDYLLNMENQWKAAEFNIRRYCAYEKKKIGGVLIVDRLSGTRNCEGPSIPINEDHFGIVKPNDRAHPSYIALRNAIVAKPSVKTGAAKINGTPLVARITEENLLASVRSSSAQCRGYQLFMTPEMDKTTKIIPLDSVHLTIRFPEIVRDFRVFVGTNIASVINEPSGCHFEGPPSANETVNSKALFDVYENKFSFDAHSLNEAILAEFLTDETTPDVLFQSLLQQKPIITKFPKLIEYDGFYRYNGSAPNSNIDFQFNGIDTFIVFKIKDSSPETFSMVLDNPALGSLMEIMPTPMTIEQLRQELNKKGKGEDQIETIIQYARAHPELWPQKGWIKTWIDSFALRDGVHPPRIEDYRLLIRQHQPPEN